LRRSEKREKEAKNYRLYSGELKAGFEFSRKIIEDDEYYTNMIAHETNKIKQELQECLWANKPEPAVPKIKKTVDTFHNKITIILLF